MRDPRVVASGSLGLVAFVLGLGAAPSVARAQQVQQVPPVLLAPLAPLAPHWRRVEPYHGGPVPQGARLEHRPPVRGIIIGGGATLAVGWMMGASFGFASLANRNAALGDAWSLLPLVGPFVAATHVQPSGGFFDLSGLVAGMLVFDGAVQIVGAGLLVAGLASGHDVLVFDDRSARWTVLPGASGAPLGATFAAAYF